METIILNKVKNYIDTYKGDLQYYGYRIIAKDFLYNKGIITEEELNIIYYNENNHYYEDKIKNLIKNK